MTQQHITAFLIYTLTSWAAWILQRNKMYQGNYGDVIRGVLSSASVVGRVLVAIFVIRLFFVDSFAWYTPIVIALCGEVANIILLVPLYTIVCGRNFLLATAAHLLSLLGLIALLIAQILFFHKS